MLQQSQGVCCDRRLQHKKGLHNESVRGHPSTDGENLMRPHPEMKRYRQLIDAEKGRITL